MVRFGPFRLDPRTGELRRGDARLKVPFQSIEILKALLERPGDLVTREDLRQRVWASDTFVDFEHGLNAAVRRLRDALGDAADSPSYIETLPRRGYRFIAAVETAAPEARRSRTVAAAIVVCITAGAWLASDAPIRSLVPAGAGRPSPRETHVNAEAYREYLRGMYLQSRRTPDALAQAQRSFQHSIEIDPGYAPAHAALALVLVHFGTWNGTMAPGAVYEAAKAEAETALTLDASLPDGHIVMAMIRRLFEWNWPAADAAFARGLALGAAPSWALLAYANHLTALGRFDESIAICRDVTRRDPLSPQAHQELGFAYTIAGRDEEAMAAYSRSLALDTGLHSARVYRAFILMRRGQIPEAAGEVDVFGSQLGKAPSPHRLGQLGYLSAKIGRRDAAEQLLCNLQARASTDYVPASAIGNVYLGLGRRDEALAEYSRAIDQHDVWAIWLNTNPLYTELRGDSRFQALVERLRFPK